ncbi:hypothetical protein DM860_007444 [Cuscuta australis]|uniref:Uncharacterized protein n=1 Tax=Cuscuta australis TaxID=267555 RepID=A0A328E5D7_9ASTE|nr:hypothetical protein DM860_007444 [Cuscuta australis]
MRIGGDGWLGRRETDGGRLGRRRERESLAVVETLTKRKCELRDRHLFELKGLGRALVGQVPEDGFFSKKLINDSSELCSILRHRFTRRRSQL